MNSASPILPPPVERAIVAEGYRAWRSLRRFGFDRADIGQELVFHWIRRRRRYDASRSAESTFAAHVCRRRAIQLIETASAGKRGGGGAVVSLSDPVSLGEDGMAERADTISSDTCAINTGLQNRPGAELAELRLDVARVLAGLPASLAGLAHRLRFQSVTSAAQAMGISRATAYRNVAVLRAAFVEAGLDLYVIRRPPARPDFIGGAN